MKRMFIGTLILSVFCIIICVLVSVFLPGISTSNEEVAAKDTKSPAQINTESLHSQLVSHSEKIDSGLELYRSLQSRAGVINFYTNVTGNTDIALAVLEYADKNSIPLSLAFSLAYAESRYQIDAVNTNSNESTDRGLFQLNDKSFPLLTEADFFNPYISAKYGMSHLRFCIDTAGNEIAGLAMYNAGSNKVRRNNTPQHTLNYVSVIMNYREGLEALFRTQVAAIYKPDLGITIAKK